MVTMMVRRKGGGEEGGIDGIWGDEDGREHRSLVVRNDEQGGGEKESRHLGGTCCSLSSPWWAMMIFGVEALVWMMFLSLPQSHPLLHLPVLCSIVADSESFSISMEGRRGFYSIIA